MIGAMPPVPIGGRILDPETAALRARVSGDPQAILDVYGREPYKTLVQVEDILCDDAIYKFIEDLGTAIGEQDPSGFPFEVTINLARSYDDPCLGMTSIDAQVRIASERFQLNDLMLGPSDSDLLGLAVGALLTGDAFTVVVDIFEALVREYDRLVVAAGVLGLHPGHLEH